MPAGHEARMIELEQRLQAMGPLLEAVSKLGQSQIQTADELKSLLADAVSGAGAALGFALNELADQGHAERTSMISVLEKHLKQMEKSRGPGLDRVPLEQALAILRANSEGAGSPPGAGWPEP